MRSNMSRIFFWRFFLRDDIKLYTRYLNQPKCRQRWISFFILDPIVKLIQLIFWFIVLNLFWNTMLHFQREKKFEIFGQMTVPKHKVFFGKNKWKESRRAVEISKSPLNAKVRISKLYLQIHVLHQNFLVHKPGVC